MRILHLVLLMASSICSVCVAAQVRVERLSLVDPSVAELFPNVPNKLRISGVLPTDSVGFKHSAVRTRVGNEFLVNVTTDALADTLLVHRAGKAIFREAYRIAADRGAAVNLGTTKLTGLKTATVKDLTESNKLVITTGNYRSEEIEVKGYELSIVKDGIYNTYGKTAGPMIGNTQHTQLASLHAGDLVYFDEIKVKLDGRIRTLHPISLRVTD